MYTNTDHHKRHSDLAQRAPHAVRHSPVKKNTVTYYVNRIEIGNQSSIVIVAYNMQGVSVGS